MENENAKELHQPADSLEPGYEGELQGEEEGEELSATDRILYVVTSPKKAFRGLRSAKLGSLIGVSIVVSILLSLASTLLMFSSTEFVQKMKTDQIEKLQKKLDDPGISDAERKQMEKGIDQIQGTSPQTYIVFGAIGPVIGIPLIACFIGLVILIIAKIMEKTRETNVNYAGSLAVASLGSVVYVIGGVIVAGLILLTGNSDLSLGLTALIKSDSKVLNSLLGALSLNLLWWYAVVGIGIAAIAKTSVMKATLTFAGVMVVLAIAWGFIQQAAGGLLG